MYVIPLIVIFGIKKPQTKFEHCFYNAESCSINLLINQIFYDRAILRIKSNKKYTIQLKIFILPIESRFCIMPLSTVNVKKKYPNGHTMSNRRRFHVDITWIQGRPNFNEFPCHFHELFRCNFGDRKIHVVSTYFCQCNFDGRKIHFVFTYFFRCNFDGRKIRIVFTYFFRCNFNGRKILVFSTYFFSM